jgi:hypothetical protein
LLPHLMQFQNPRHWARKSYVNGNMAWWPGFSR